ncbi:MAG TPA: class I adenylate-forming enzyme family protein, partial [Isosphaeraceae bacterium]|nr:class I adenylate-forming enzyme family protein [Isosphaeraceae bacterium]
YLHGRERTISYAQMHIMMSRLAVRLAENPQFSERPFLGACLLDQERLLQLIWACLRSGICLAFIPVTRDVEHLRQLVRPLELGGMITDVPELRSESLQILLEDLFGPDTACGPPECPCQTDLQSDPNRPAFLFQTSGTTGEAKWVLVRYGQFSEAIHCLRGVGGLKHAVGQAVFLTPPLSHSYGLSALLEYTMVGSSIILPRGSSPLGPLADLADPEVARLVTAIEAVPNFYGEISRLLARLDLPRLRHIGLGGGALESKVIERFRKIYPNLSYSVRYGMTETPSVVTHKLFLPPYNDDWSSSGRVLPLYTLRIVDTSGRPLGPFRVGEIVIEGGPLALPYYGRHEVHDGTYATGDLGFLDDEGDLHVVGRKSAYLKIRGYRISQESIEAVLGLHEGVRACRVLMQGSCLIAEVERTDRPVSEKALVTFASERLPRYAVPQVVTFVQNIPRTSTGKIVRSPPPHPRDSGD